MDERTNRSSLREGARRMIDLRSGQAEQGNQSATEAAESSRQNSAQAQEAAAAAARRRASEAIELAKQQAAAEHAAAQEAARQQALAEQEAARRQALAMQAAQQRQAAQQAARQQALREHMARKQAVSAAQAAARDEANRMQTAVEQEAERRAAAAQEVPAVAAQPLVPQTADQDLTDYGPVRVIHADSSWSDPDFPDEDEEAKTKGSGRGRLLAILVVLLLVVAGAGFGISRWLSGSSESDTSVSEKQAAMQQLMAQQASAAEQAAAEIAVEDTEKEDFCDILASYGSTYDTHNTAKEINLQLCCEAIDGTILEPGEEFSFNDIVGERTVERGYQECSAYVGNDISQELGGGICQVASTIYCCVLYADLEVVERSCHKYVVSYVPLGMDATVYWDYNLDFKFANNTDHPIRIDASTADGECWVFIRGIDDYNYIRVITNELVSTNDYKTTTYETAGEDVDGITGYTYRISRLTYNSSGKLIKEETYDDLGSLIGYSVYSKRDAIIYNG